MSIPQKKDRLSLIQEARDNWMKENLKNETRFKGTSSNGKTIFCLTKSTKKPGFWQFTSIRNNVPIGDVQYASYLQAIRGIKSEGFDWTTVEAIGTKRD